MNMQSTGRLTTCQYARFLRREGIRTWTRAIKSVWSLEPPAVKSSQEARPRPRSRLGADSRPRPSPGLPLRFQARIQVRLAASTFLFKIQVPMAVTSSGTPLRSCWSEKYQDKQNAAQIFIDVKTLIQDSTVWSESYQDGGNAARFHFDSKTLISVDKKVPRRRKCCPIFLRRRFNSLGSDIIRIG